MSHTKQDILNKDLPGAGSLSGTALPALLEEGAGNVGGGMVEWMVEWMVGVAGSNENSK